MRTPFPSSDWVILIPELILFAGALIVLMLDAFGGRFGRRSVPWVSLLAVANSVSAAIALRGLTHVGFLGMIVTDPFVILIKLAILAGAGLAILASVDYTRREELPQGEYYALLLLSSVGMMLLAASRNLIMIFLSLETLSIALYVLTCLARKRGTSQEAGLKYFLLGSFSAAILVYGVALIYGATGTVDLLKISGMYEQLAPTPMLLAGLGLVIVGLGFKVAAVPFHMWTPDVYEGAPSSVTAFMSVATKAAAFGALARVLIYGFDNLQREWWPVIWAVAALTMIAGNVIAIAQDNIKRMLAYSSIAHAGYILVAVAAGNGLGIQSIPFYLITYTFMNLGAWAVVTAVTRKGEEATGLSDYAGLFRTNPLLAGSMAIFLFSLAGLPPTAGFMAKVYILSAAFQAQKAHMVGLVIVVVLTSLVSAYYYLRVTVLMFMERGKNPPVVQVRWPMALAIAICAIMTVLLFVFPGLTQSFTQSVAEALK